MIRLSTTCVLLFAACGAPSIRAEVTLPPALRNVGFDQKLDAQVPLELPFVDDSGRAVLLGDYFGERPVVLVLAYYRCPMLCTLVLNGLVRGLADVSFDAGRDFEVVVVSIDSRETPKLAAEKKRNYVERYGRPGTTAGWHFLTGAEDSIEALAAAVGFRYAYDPNRDEFAHASGITILTPQGRVSRYFYDVKFSPRDLRLGLVEASQGTIGSPVDEILLFCFHYDPAEGKYGAAIMSFVRVGGLLTMFAVVGLLVFLSRARRLSPRASDPATRSAGEMAENHLAADMPASLCRTFEEAG